MKIIDCEQRQAKWFAMRCGKPTGSGLANIVTQTGKAVTGAKRNTYMRELLWERLTGDTFKRFENDAMRRGNELEPKAVQYYEMMHDCEVKQVGFCLHDKGHCGVSPDGFVSEKKGLEIKTATAAQYMAKLIDNCIPSCNVVQIQSCLWVCEYETWDFLLYDPQLPCMEFTAYRDEKVISALDKYVLEFTHELDALEDDICKRYGLKKRTIDAENMRGDWRPF